MSTTKNKALAERLLTMHLEDLLRLYESGELTAADRGVALKTIQAMGVQMIPTQDNPLGQLQKAVTDSLPFAGEQAHTFQ